MKARFIGHRKSSRVERTDRQFTLASARGFTLLELIFVVCIVLVLAAIALPNFINSIGSGNLRGGMSQLSGIVNSCRTQAIKDNSTKRLRFTNVGTDGRWAAYVDGAVDDASAPTGLTSSTNRPMTIGQVWLPQQMVKVSAPTGTSPASLTAAAMWGGTDMTQPESVKDICFNSRGVPCNCPATSIGICTAITMGYAYYFNYRTPSTWGAIGVSPAGRITTYFWDGTSWSH
jgi:prepilin-type N-terminal cleavage/methylation domain-containing protein